MPQNTVLHGTSQVDKSATLHNAGTISHFNSYFKFLAATHLQGEKEVVIQESKCTSCLISN
jgi:hypothetical protein